jgi:hypothetical protein
MIALPFSYQRRSWFLSAWRLFQHDDGFEESVGHAVLVRKKVGAQAFAASLQTGSLVWTLGAIARLVYRIGGLKTELAGFQRGRTRADWLSSYAMSQRTNQALETTATAVTDRADARSAPSAAVSHL